MLGTYKQLHHLNWRRPPGRPCTMYMRTIQQDLKSNNLSLNEAIDVAQNRPLWRLMSTFDATHSQWCMPEMNECMNDNQIATSLSAYSTCVDRLSITVDVVFHQHRDWIQLSTILQPYSDNCVKSDQTTNSTTHKFYFLQSIQLTE